MNTQPENIVNLKTELEKTQAVCIAKAVDKGHQDPFNDKIYPDNVKTLEYKVNGKDVRRYIKEFGYVHVDELNNNNIRLNEIDEEWVETELLPKVLKAGKIKCPIMTVKTTTSLETIEHGHNRTWTSRKAFGDQRKIPRFSLTPPYVLDETGENIQLADNRKYLETLSAIKCNPGKKNAIYSMDDIAGQLQKLYKQDPTFAGVHPSGEPPNREEFNAIMDDVYPDDYLHKGTRTKIYNKWQGGKVLSANRKIDKSALIMSARNAGYTVPVETKMSPNAFPEFGSVYDKDNHAYLCDATDKGEDLQTSIFLKIIMLTAEGNSFEFCETRGYPEVVLFHKITASSPTTKTGVEKSRSAFIAKVEKLNAMLEHFGDKIPVRVNKIISPPHLKDQTDGQLEEPLTTRPNK
jgi:hypothetical protein